jgi:hypothetical protein
MLRCFIAVSIGVVVLCLHSQVSAQGKADKAAQAKMASEKFIKTLFAERDHPGAMKLVAVPFSIGFETFDKIEDLKKKIDKEVRGPKEPKSIITIHSNKTLEELSKVDDPDAKEFTKLFSKVMKKNDRVVGAYFGPKEEGRGVLLLVLVAWREGQPKVVGWTTAPPDLVRPKKK